MNKLTEGLRARSVLRSLVRCQVSRSDHRAAAFALGAAAVRLTFAERVAFALWVAVPEPFRAVPLRLVLPFGALLRGAPF